MGGGGGVTLVSGAPSELAASCACRTEKGTIMAGTVLDRISGAGNFNFLIFVPLRPSPLSLFVPNNAAS